MTKLTRLCPSCRKVFYATNDKDTHTCPNCGYSFVKKRSFQRIPRIVECAFIYKGVRYPALTKNVSDSGVCIEYSFSDEHVPQDAILGFFSRPLDIETPAQMVWVKDVERGKTVAGLKYLQTETAE